MTSSGADETVTRDGVPHEASPFRVGKGEEVCGYTKTSGTWLVGHKTGTGSRTRAKTRQLGQDWTGRNSRDG